MHVTGLFCGGAARDIIKPLSADRCIALASKVRNNVGYALHRRQLLCGNCQVRGSRHNPEVPAFGEELLHITAVCPGMRRSPRRIVADSGA